MKLKAMKKQILLIVSVIIVSTVSLNAQVKIGNNPDSINNNSLLELESATKGFLPPRVAINDLVSPLPLTAPVPAGMMVYSLNGSVPDGYYNWDGAKWVKLSSSSDHINTVTKTSDALLLKTENMVLASNNITLTLPVVTSADNGLEITIKNVGTYTDQIVIVGNGVATIDINSDIKLFRWISQTFVAYNGNWLKKSDKNKLHNVFEVDSGGSWTSIAEVIAFLNLHMDEPSVVRFCGGSYPVSATQVINLPYPVTFEGSSYGETSIDGDAGVSGTPLFDCQTESYFKMLMFNAYTNTAGNDGMHFTGSGTYYEVKDCDFTGFYKGIKSTNNNELWIFETNFADCASAGIEIAAGTASGGALELSECDFGQCATGIYLLSGVSETVSIINSNFFNTTAGTDKGVVYVPATFTSSPHLSITNNSWNNQGTYLSGFDFTRADGRDANIYLQANAGAGDNNPKCKINVRNNASATTCTNSYTYYKAAWTNTSISTCNFTVGNNKITYQPKNKRNAMAIISGNLQVNSSNPVITIALIKNGSTGTPYGETNIKITSANNPFQFSTVIYLENVGPGDYFELYVYSSGAGNQVIFSDVQWFTDCK